MKLVREEGLAWLRRLGSSLDQLVCVTRRDMAFLAENSGV
jgi:hypothetical protein